MVISALFVFHEHDLSKQHEKGSLQIVEGNPLPDINHRWSQTFNEHPHYPFGIKNDSSQYPIHLHDMIPCQTPF